MTHSNQLPLFPFDNPLSKLDERVRTTEIGGEMYASILDIFKYYGNKSNPSQAWKITLKFLDKQGFEQTNEIVEWRHDAMGGRPTPMINLNGFLRIVQSTEIKEWEPIRQWLADTGEDAILSRATKKREHNIDLHEQAGLDHTYEARRYKARHENIEVLKQLKDTMKRIIENPNYATLENERYLVLFDNTASELKEILRTKSVRDALNLTQLRTLTFSEDTLKDVIASKSRISHADAVNIIRQVLPPIADMLKELMNAQGLDHVTGQPLLGKGE